MTKILYISMAVAIAFVSCQKSEKADAGAATTSSEVVFTTAISTRATGTQWDNGDKIGVFMYEESNSILYNGNVLYTTSDASSGTFTSQDPLFYPEGGSVDFIAYHPYTTNATAPDDMTTVTLNTADQSTEEGVKAQDFMVASVQDCNEENRPSLEFTRKMSKITIIVTRKDSRSDAVLYDISLGGVVVDGTFSICNITSYINAPVAVGSTTSDISMFFNEASSTIEAIIVPQTLTSAELLMWIDGEGFVATISGTFEENKQYSYYLSIGSDSVEFTLGSINDWGEVVDSGDMGTAKISYFASEISADMIPEADIWIISDSGEITSTLMAGVRAALDAASEAGRTIALSIPNATSIGEAAFSYWNNFLSIELGKVTTIGNYAFRGCFLTSFDFTGVTSIGDTAFAGNMFATIELPSTVTYVGEFALVSEYTTTIILHWTGDEIIAYDYSTWGFILSEIDLYIPSGTTADYAAKGWTGAKSVTEMTE